jgi:hypothetical protein
MSEECIVIVVRENQCLGNIPLIRFEDGLMQTAWVLANASKQFTAYRRPGYTSHEISSRFGIE